MPGSDAKRADLPVVELRQYTLHPGQRDVLIELFDREFVESQDAAGAVVMGQFRDLDRPDRFVWMRGFADMPRRAEALSAFYGGPVWAAHRDAANATMIDFDDVRLLRPAWPGSGFAVDPSLRPPPGSAGNDATVAIAGIIPIPPSAVEPAVSVFAVEASPLLEDAGGAPCAVYVTDTSPNTFPALPVREGETVLVWFGFLADADACERHIAELSASGGWARAIGKMAGAEEVMPAFFRLSPTARSALRGGNPAPPIQRY